MTRSQLLHPRPKSTRKPKPKPRWAGLIEVDTFHTEIPVFVTVDDWIADCQRLGHDYEEPEGPTVAFAARSITPSGTPMFSLVVPKDTSFDTWAHEAVHICDFIMQYVGIPHSFENTEVRAYLVGHIFRGIQEALNSPRAEVLMQEALERQTPESRSGSRNKSRSVNLALRASFRHKQPIHKDRWS